MWLSDDLCPVHCCSNLLLHVSITIIRLTCRSKPKKLGAVFNLMGQVVWLLPQRRRLGSIPTLVQPMSLTPWPSRHQEQSAPVPSSSCESWVGRCARRQERLTLPVTSWVGPAVCCCSALKAILLQSWGVLIPDDFKKNVFVCTIIYKCCHLKTHI